MKSAFQYIGLAAAPGVAPRVGTRNLVRLLGLDGPPPVRLPVVRPRLVCRWRQDPNGRLSCVWEEDFRVPSEAIRGQ